ncbi:MAG: murein biosynthesis integral membrane protein MurJ [Hyphomicrobiaceae bacterium]
MNLFKSILTVGGYTMASRVLGFLRDILIARVLGTGMVADAFFVSQRFPNLFRSLFAEGAFNAAFVPQFARRIEGEGLPAAKEFAEHVLAVMVTVLFVFSVAAIAGMPWLMYLLAGGYADDPQKFLLCVSLTQITFPYLFFMSLTALQGGVLNSLHRYAHAAAAPILLNVVMIIALVAVVPLTGVPATTLAWAMTIAGVGQFLWMYIACRRAGAGLRLVRPRLGPDVRKLFRLMVPGIIGSGVMQLNLVIGTQIASWQDSAVSYLYYADRIYQLPLAVIGSAAGVVLLPELSKHLRAGRDGDAIQSINRGIELVLLLTLPAAAALVAISHPIISVLFERGAFTAEDSTATALALGIYGVGLPAFVLIKVLTPPFYAREDTATPFRLAVISMIVNTVLSAALFLVVGFAGIAIATVFASWLNIGMLTTKLHRAGYFAADDRLRSRLPRVLASAAVMGAALAGLAWLGADALSSTAIIRLSTLMGLVVAGLLLYGLTATLLRAAPVDELKATLRRRRAAKE